MTENSIADGESEDPLVNFFYDYETLKGEEALQGLSQSQITTFEVAARALDEEDVLVALDLWRGLVIEVPENAYIRHNFGLTLALAGQHGAAFNCFTEALEIQPELVPAERNQFVAYNQHQIQENFETVFAQKCLSFQEAGDFGSLFPFVEEYLETHPFSFVAEIRLSMARTLNDEPEQGLIHAERAVRLVPDHPRGYYMKARALSALGQAVAAFDAMVQSVGLTVDVQDDIWTRLASMGQAATQALASSSPDAAAAGYARIFPAVQTACNALLESRTDTPDVLLLRGNSNLVAHSLKLGGDLAAAAQDFEHVLRLQPGNEAAQQQLRVARSLLAHSPEPSGLSDLNAKSKHWMELVGESPTYRIPEFEASVIVLKPGSDPAESAGLSIEREYRKLLKQFPDNKEVREGLAHHLWRMGEFYQKAISYLFLRTTVEELTDEDIPVDEFALVARLHQQMPLHAQKAARCYVEANEITPHCHAAWGLADLYEGVRFRGSALHWFEVALQIAEENGYEEKIAATMRESIKNIGSHGQDPPLESVVDKERGCWFPTQDTPGLRLDLQPNPEEEAEKERQAQEQERLRLETERHRQAEAEKERQAQEQERLRLEAEQKRRAEAEAKQRAQLAEQEAADVKRQAEAAEAQSQAEMAEERRRITAGLCLACGKPLGFMDKTFGRRAHSRC